MAAPAILALLGRSLAGATMRLGGVARTVGKSVKAATLAVGQQAGPALGQVGRMAAPVARIGKSLAGGRLPNTKEMLNAVRGPQQVTQQIKGGGVVQRISQSIINTFRGDPSRDVAERYRPQVAAQDLGRMLGGDPISRAQSDDWHQRQTAAGLEDVESRRAAAAQSVEDFAGAATKGVLAVNALAGATILAGKGLSAFAKGRMEGIQNLRMFNGGIAGDFIRLEQQRIQLERRKAHSVAATSGMLTESLLKLNEAAQPLEESLTNAGNALGSLSAEAVAMVLEFVNWKAQFVKNVADEIPMLRDAIKEIQEFLNSRKGQLDPGMAFLKLGAAGALKNTDPQQPLPRR